MLATANPVVWLLGFVVVAAALLLLRSQFGAEAREQRRRRKSHRPVVSKRGGPTVKLAVRTKNPKD